MEVTEFEFKVWLSQWVKAWLELEQLERLRSKDIPRRLMITHAIES